MRPAAYIARWVATLTVLCAAVLVRAEIQNEQIGFSPNHVFESSNAGENIDVMSGNLNLTIPLGPRYKLTESFDYGLTLYYNSKIWEYNCDPEEYPDEPCVPTSPISHYGLGFNMIPGRIYHHDEDYDWVYRLQLEDGSEHFFCDGSPSGSIGCVPGYTIDATHLKVDKIPGPTFTGWSVETTDGKTMIFGDVTNLGEQEARVSSIRTTAVRADGSPFAAVNYEYNSYGLSRISDSQGREILFTRTGDSIHIDFPGFVPSESWQPGTKARYTLEMANISALDPSDHGSSNTREVLEKIIFPVLSASEAYEFFYTRGTEPTHGWLLSRKLPTGATTNYYYQVYFTSKNRPYHTELKFKILTLGNPARSYRWSWSRFSESVLTSYDSSTGSAESRSFKGSNPWQVKALDPFDNVTVYNFHWTPHLEMNSTNGGNCYLGECANSWDDGLLASVAMYAGPDPDTSRLVSYVENEWDSERTTTNGPHRMFKYRMPYRGEFNPGQPTQSPPVTANSMSVKSRQIGTRTITPGAAAHEVEVVSSDWYHGVRPMLRDEYVDGVLYRTTRTEIDPSAGNWDAHKFVRVTDAAGNVVSGVDRRFENGQLKCQVVRGNGIPTQALTDCSALSLGAGDVATINTFDPMTGVTTSTDVKRDSDASPVERTISMTYLAAGGSVKTPYRKTAKYDGFTWNAVDRDVDFNTGLTSASRDAAGNLVTYTWDALGRLTRITPTAPEKPTTITYTNLRETHVKQVIDSSNYTESVYLYDELGRLTTTKRRNRDGLFDVQATEYDIAGRVTRRSEWYADGAATGSIKWTTFDYTSFEDLDSPPTFLSRHADPLGRVHSVTTPDDPTPDTPTTETTYDGNLTVVKVRDIRGWASGVDTPLISTTIYTKDGLGRLVAVDSPGMGADAQYTYDHSDNLTEVRLVDPAVSSQVQLRRFEYDRAGRLRTAVNPENGTVTYISYDARGNLLSYKDARQNVFTMTYDKADRLLSRVQEVDGQPLDLVQNTYDAGVGFNAGGAQGRLVEQISSGITGTTSAEVSRTRFGFGAANSSASCTLGSGGYAGLNGRQSWQTTRIHPWSADLRTDYCQDTTGAPTKIGYPELVGSGRTRTQVQSTTQNGYLAGLYDVGRWSSYIGSIHYAPGGVPHVINRAGSKETIELDVRNRPARIFGTYYHYTPPGQGSGSVSCEDVELHPELYPELVGLSACGDPEIGGGTWTPADVWDSGAYSYDMAGNVKSIGSEQYHYDPLNRLVHASMPLLGSTHILDFVFDGFGNMTSQSRETFGASTVSTSRSYVVDWQTNRLSSRSWTVGSSTVSASYAFDENGNMISEGTKGFVFDGQGRLRQVMDTQAGQLGSYDYDASGYRVHTNASGKEMFVFRDAAGQVLSEFQRQTGSTDAPVWNKDYIYALGKSLAIVQNDIPMAPVRPKVTSASTSQVTIEWDLLSEPDVVAYQVERLFRKLPTTEETTSVFTVSSPTHTFTDSTFLQNPYYVKYRVRAMDAAGNFGDQGPQIAVYIKSGYVLSAPPVAPPNDAEGHSLYATAGDRSVTLHWNDASIPSENDIAGYRVERSPSNNPYSWTLRNTQLITSTEYFDNALQNGATYWYRVFTVDSFGRQSTTSSEVAWATPDDSAPPGKLTEVFADPDLPVGQVRVSWKRGLDLDISHYRLYRSTSSATLGSEISTTMAGSQDLYYFVDAGLPQGVDYYYRVVAYDTTSQASDPSDPAIVRPRNSSVAIPTGFSAVLEFDNQGTTSSHGTGNDIHKCDVAAEDDDVVRVAMQWSTSGGWPLAFRVYRKGLNDAAFARIATVPYVQGVSTYSFDDVTLAKGDAAYYYVTKYSSQHEESAASSTVTVAQPYSSNPSVRNVMVVDSREFYYTENRESRFARVKWSRITEPGLVGYNVYRRCSFDECPDARGMSSRMDTFACEPNWIRLNTTPLPPTQREFFDAETGGLQGCFLYAVRPVRPDQSEGPITKVVAANLRVGQHANEDYPADHCYAPTNISKDDVAFTPQTLDAVLNGTASEPLTGINDHQPGTGSPAGPPPAPTSVSRTGILTKAGADGGTLEETKFATVTWTMSNAPSDLLGFHVETAGSPDGPWQRLTKSPTAWWERRYTAQVGLPLNSGGFTDHHACLSYRVLAVDTLGTESQPVPAVGNPTSQACPATPPPPQNLRASTVWNPNDYRAHTRLDWDPSPDAVEYIVYRLVNFVYRPYFYPTQHVSAPTITFEEEGADSVFNASGPEDSCPYGTTGFCDLGHLDAFYVTARKAGGGESPRSNLAIWHAGDEPGDYVRLMPPSDLPNVEGLGDAIACWETDGGLEDLAVLASSSLPHEGDPQAAREETPIVQLVTAPMLHLGSYSNPPWVVLNLFTDHLGTVRAVYNSTTQTIDRHNYFPFGEEIAPVVSSFNTHQYTGHERDSETGLDYMLARYYGLGTARFLSVDPSPRSAIPEVPQSWNRFPYVLNNPMRLIDPSGKEADVAVDKTANTVTVSATIDIYGPDATDQVAEDIESAGEAEWNGQTFTDTETGESYQVIVDFTVQNVGCGNDPTAPNQIEIDNRVERSSVSGGNRGTWKADKRPTLYAHELGHVMGLRDDYTNVTGPNGVSTSVPNAGHAGHMMATNPGIVAPHEIADVVSTAVSRANASSDNVVVTKVP